MELRTIVRYVRVSVVLLGVCFAALGEAAVLQTPAGGKITFDHKHLCGQVPEGWQVDADHHGLRPERDLAAGSSAVIHLAAEGTACTGKLTATTVVATGPWPQVDPGSVTFWPDEGRVEFKGSNLRGAVVVWSQGNRSGEDACQDPTQLAHAEQCNTAVAHGLSADAWLSALPAGSRHGEGVVTFDLAGRPVGADHGVLRPAKIVLNRAIPSTGAVDLTDGLGRIALPHPECVASVDCGSARCELADGAVLVRSVPGIATAVSVKVRLSPHVFVARGDGFDQHQAATFTLAHCPITLLSGPPIRDLDDVRVIVRLDQRCSKDPRLLRWTADGDPVDVLRVEKDGDAHDVVLRVGRLEDDHVTLAASRAEPDAPVLAVLAEKTRVLPQPRMLIELSGYGPIEFIPKNRGALVRLAPIDDHTRMHVLPVEGVYSSSPQADGWLVRGSDLSGGSVQLRLAVRADGLPAVLRGVNLAVLTDVVQRPVRDATMPVPLADSGDRPDLVELLCQVPGGPDMRLLPGLSHIDFTQRDGCRLVIHRGRLRPEDGTQDLMLEIDIAALDGSPRPLGKVADRILLRAGPDDKVYWIKGVRSVFDRIQVRLYHVIDETRYLISPEGRPVAPALQWSIITGTGRVRFYATAAFPTGLYRVTNPTGLLTLNFGVMSRIVILDSEGREGLVGIELGAIGVGLVSTSSLPNYPATLATVAGLGVSVPLGNAGQPTQASLNLHAWVSYEWRSDFKYYPSAADATADTQGHWAPHWAFIFGPSISIGNIGTVL